MKLPREGRTSAKLSPLSFHKQPSPLMQPHGVTPRLSSSTAASLSPTHAPLAIDEVKNIDNKSNGEPFALPASTAKAEAAAEHDAMHLTSRARRRAAKKEKKKAKANASSSSLVKQLAGSAATTSERLNLTAFFSKVELSFELAAQRGSNSSASSAGVLYPRDIANLLLWSVPCAVPLIEAPRMFFVKNRSRVRNVVMIYVNGWSYDMLMCTGAGLPRPAQPPPPPAKPRTADDTASDAQVVQEGGKEEEEAVWNERICAALLGPVRRGQCWARGTLGSTQTTIVTSSSSSSTGVQYAPVLVPSVKNTLEQDLFWRNDRPRVPRSRSSTTVVVGVKAAAESTAGDEVHAGEKQKEEEDGGGRTHAVPAETTVPGVGTLFKRARAIHEEQNHNTHHGDDGGAQAAADGTRKGTSATEDAKESSRSDGNTKNAAAAAAAAHATVADTQEQDWARLWQDRATLLTYALHMSQHAEALQALGFTLEPDEDDDEGDEKDEAGKSDTSATTTTAQWRCFLDKLPEDNTNTSSSGTATSQGSHVALRVYAFDCEMVLVEGQVSALARATLVEVRSRRVVLDWLVKPRENVINYLTRYSGVDEAMLADVKTTLRDVQAALCTYIDSSNTFVVGHSLENDFKACKLIPNCYLLDTAWLYPHPSGLPYKNSLRFLMMRYLQRRIQDGAHDSSVDALSSAELVFLKLLHGPTFGVRERVSVLGLMAEAASAKLRVRLRLFDEPATLQSMLPPKGLPPQPESATTCSSEAEGRASVFLDTVPVRHDEDATRKVVRSLLQHRHRHHQESGGGTSASHEAVQTKDGQTENEEDEVYTFTWVQLSETAVDVLQHRTRGNRQVADKPSAHVAEDDAKAEEGEEDDEEAARYEAEQLAAVEATNKRVLRIVEACEDETVVVLLAAACKGEVGGNHFSRAQGACFAWVKDGTAPGPPEGYLHPASNNTVEGDKGVSRESCAANTTQQAAAVAVVETPPACNAQ